MIEQGSDSRFAQLADTSDIGRRARLERIGLWLEEWAVRTTLPASDEPGHDYPDPDETPPPGQPHPEFDPTPPA